MTCEICRLPEGEGQCQDCRALAEEIRINSAVLADLRDEVLPLEVMGGSRRKRVFRWGAAAAILIALALPLDLTRPRVAPVPARYDAGDTHEPLKVKILTPDPDVVIYWLIDSKEQQLR